MKSTRHEVYLKNLDLMKSTRSLIESNMKLIRSIRTMELDLSGIV